jgi:hypothetical protein
MRLFLAALLASAARLAGATTIDGRLDAEYGPALATQATQTTAGDNSQGQSDYSLGAELDEGYGYISNGVLYLFLSGSLTFYWNLEGQTTWLPLDIFIDSTPGGQHALLANNPVLDPFAYDLNKLAGLRFDSDFEADHWLSCGGNVGTWPRMQAFDAELPTVGGGAGAYLGTTNAGGPGTLTGGTNPQGIQFAFDLHNTAGVTAGCAGSSGAGVTTGFEWAIPLAAIGNPTGCVKVCSFPAYGDHSQLFNQVLGPLPPGTCSLGPAAGVDLSNVPGNQYFTVCPTSTPTRTNTWGRLKTIYR